MEVEGIVQEEVETAMYNMNTCKATGADEVRLELMEMAGVEGVKWTGRLLNVCMQEERIPKVWMMDLIVQIGMRKWDVHGPGKYRGIKLLSQVLKLISLRFVIRALVGDDSFCFPVSWFLYYYRRAVFKI